MPAHVMPRDPSGERSSVRREPLGACELVGTPLVLRAQFSGGAEPHLHVARDARGHVTALAECLPEGSSLVVRVTKAAAAPQEAMDELLDALAAELSACGVGHLLVVVPMERFGLLEDFRRAGYLVESLLTEGGVADVSLRVPGSSR